MLSDKMNTANTHREVSLNTGLEEPLVKTLTKEKHSTKKMSNSVS